MPEERPLPTLPPHSVVLYRDHLEAIGPPMVWVSAFLLPDGSRAYEVTVGDASPVLIGETLTPATEVRERLAVELLGPGFRVAAAFVHSRASQQRGFPDWVDASNPEAPRPGELIGLLLADPGGPILRIRRVRVDAEVMRKLERWPPARDAVVADADARLAEIVRSLCRVEGIREHGDSLDKLRRDRIAKLVVVLVAELLEGNGPRLAAQSAAGTPVLDDPLAGSIPRRAFSWMTRAIEQGIPHSYVLAVGSAWLVQNGYPWPRIPEDAIAYRRALTRVLRFGDGREMTRLLIGDQPGLRRQLSAGARVALAWAAVGDAISTLIATTPLRGLDPLGGRHVAPDDGAFEPLRRVWFAQVTSRWRRLRDR